MRAAKNDTQFMRNAHIIRKVLMAINIIFILIAITGTIIEFIQRIKQ